MFNTQEIKDRLPLVTKTIGGHDVRDLELIEIKNNKLIIIGELKPMGLDEWSTKDAIWQIVDGFYGQWSGGSEYFDLDIFTEDEYLDKKEQYLKTLTHTKGGYPIKNLHLVRDGYFNDGITYIRGDYFRQDINDWVINEIWHLNGQHLVEPTDYHIDMK